MVSVVRERTAHWSLIALMWALTLPSLLPISRYALDMRLSALLNLASNLIAIRLLLFPNRTDRLNGILRLCLQAGFIVFTVVTLLRNPDLIQHLMSVVLKPNP